MTDSEFIGLIAGNGALPVEFAKRAAARGFRVLAIGATPGVSPEIAEHVERFLPIPITQWGHVVHALERHGVKSVYVLGSVPKRALYGGAPMDERFLSVVRSAQDASDNALFRAFADDLAGCGITIREQMELLPELTAGPGVLTSREPTEEEWRDVRFAFRMAKGLAQLDIGQTVVVKRQAVLAVEAIEGTDATLRRGAQLGRGDVVACKVAKPDQDPRFDLPTVGPDTVRTMAECGVRVLAFEAHRTILVDREKMQDVADGAGVSLVAVESGFEEGGASCAS